MPANQPKQSPQSQNPTDILAIISIILAFLAPPIGLIISLIALYRISVYKHGGRVLAIIALIISLLLTVVIALAIFVFGALISILGQSIQGLQKPNQAKVEMQPMIADLVRHSGQIICDNGDNGYGIDNGMPWYDIYLTANDSGLEAALITSSSNQGYHLHADTQRTNTTNSATDQSNERDAQYTSLTDTTGGKNLEITIVRNGPMTLHCSGDNWNKQQSANGTQDMVELKLLLPTVKD